MKQCTFAQNTVRTVGWIEDRAAKLGAKVELKGEDGLWDVIGVGSSTYTAKELADKQRADRNQRSASDI